MTFRGLQYVPFFSETPYNRQNCKLQGLQAYGHAFRAAKFDWSSTSSELNCDPYLLVSFEPKIRTLVSFEIQSQT